MLINLSNHPHTKWGVKQKENALDLYGELIDIPFPYIDPSLDIRDIQKEVDDMLKEIIKHKPSAVHVMGEFVFTYTMVNKLRSLGIPCIVSTTHRLVEEKEGKKIVKFEFVKFRNVYSISKHNNE